MRMQLFIALLLTALPAMAEPLEPICPPRDADCLQQAEAAALRCPVVQSMSFGSTEVVWRRCGPANPEWAADGGLMVPRSFLLLQALSWRAAYAFGDPERESADRLESIELVPARPAPLLLIEAVDSGTARVLHWALLDVEGKELTEIALPEDLDARAARLLKKGETFCCRDWQVEHESGRLTMARPTRRQTDAQSTVRAMVELVLEFRGHRLIVRDARRKRSRGQ